MGSAALPGAFIGVLLGGGDPVRTGVSLLLITRERRSRPVWPTAPFDSKRVASSHRTIERPRLACAGVALPPASDSAKASMPSMMRGPLMASL
jgi:hypothetical protein